MESVIFFRKSHLVRLHSARRADIIPPPAKPLRAAVGADKRDKYGLRVGTKGSMAASMLESGCTMAKIKEATGGTRYNLVRKLTAAGHEIVRGEKGQLTLRHNGG